MVNTRQKGRMYELLAKKKLEEAGWLVSLTDMPQKFKKSQDFFGLFDILAIKDGTFRAIQVKYNCSWRKKVLTDLKQFKETWCRNKENYEVQLWDYQKGKGWVIDNV